MDNRHRRDAVTSRLRLRGYDYSTPGTYFVTICTARRMCLFGTVVDERMVLSPSGQVMESWWDSLPRRFPDTLLDEMIVTPNHIHGIVWIGADPEAATSSLKKVVHWYKTKTTNDYGLGVRTQGWQPYPGSLWQSGYFEHIVRSDKALDRFVPTSRATHHNGGMMRKIRTD